MWAGTNFCGCRVSWDGGSLPSPIPAPTQPQAPRGPGSHLSPFPGQSPPLPRAARLPLRTLSAAPRSHETRAGTVRARVVQRAVTLWRPPQPPGAHGAPEASTRRLGVGGECHSVFAPTSGPAGRRKFGSLARTGFWPGGSTCRGVPSGHELAGGAQWPGGNATASPKDNGCFSFQMCLLLSTRS